MGSGLAMINCAGFTLVALPYGHGEPSFRGGTSAPINRVSIWLIAAYLLVDASNANQGQLRVVATKYA